jgi:hypothetical protein
VTYGIGNPGPGLGHAKHVAGLNWFSGSLSDNWISNNNTNVNNKKTAQNRFHSKRLYSISKMNDNINMDSPVAG